jgi:hypothetical protein
MAKIYVANLHSDFPTGRFGTIVPVALHGKESSADVVLSAGNEWGRPEVSVSPLSAV